jgi:tetratricopeptide (TPR) repeat protein
MAIDPNSLVLSAIQQQKLGCPQEAERLYLQALDLQPGLPEAHCNLGILLHASGRLEQAAEHLQRATLLRPGLAQAWNNLGVVLRKLSRLTEGREALTEALRLAPNSAAAHHNLALLFRAQRDFQAALHHAQAAARAAPADPGIGAGVGDALLDLDRPDEAVAYLGDLSRRFPGHSRIQLNLGVACQAANELEEAAKAFGRVIQMEPDDVEAHYGLGFVHLLQGRLAEGFQGYEWRLRRPELGAMAGRQPGSPWRGEALGSRTLLIYLEQGLGDAIQFARYLPGLECRRLVVRAPRILHRLLGTLPCSLQLVGPEDFPTGVDCHASIMSLAHFRGSTLENLPAAIRYLQPEPAGVRRIAELLGPTGKPRIGLCWQGNPDHSNDRRRSIPPQLFRELVRGQPAEWVNLQIPPTPEDQALLPAPPSGVVDFMDTLCLLANLDLVVTVDTATAHAAGVLGKPTFVLLPFAPDWRWMLGRSDSPWYPSLRLFRQHRPGDWSGALADLSAAVAGFLAGSRG